MLHPRFEKETRLVVVVCHNTQPTKLTPRTALPLSGCGTNNKRERKKEKVLHNSQPNKTVEMIRPEHKHTKQPTPQATRRTHNRSRKQQTRAERSMPRRMHPTHRNQGSKSSTAARSSLQRPARPTQRQQRPQTNTKKTTRNRTTKTNPASKTHQQHTHNNTNHLRKTKQPTTRQTQRVRRTTHNQKAHKPGVRRSRENLQHPQQQRQTSTTSNNRPHGEESEYYRETSIFIE